MTARLLARIAMTLALVSCAPAPPGTTPPSIAAGAPSARNPAPPLSASTSAVAAASATVLPRRKQVPLGQPRSLAGDRYSGLRLVLDNPDRDTAVAFFQDAPPRPREGTLLAWAKDARIGWMLVLDGDSGRVSFREAWSVAWAQDSQQLIYASGDRISTEADLERTAKALGRSVTAVRNAAFADRDGTRWVVRAVSLDIATGRDEPTGELGNLELPGERPVLPKTECLETDQVLLRTRRDNLALVVTKPCFTVQAVRFEP
jgi:hypothetical protein